MTHHDDTKKRRKERSIQADDLLENPYQVLGLTRQASAEDIKKAYFAKVREFPPERAPEQFKQVRAAYDALRTPEARAATDMFLLHPPQPYEPYKRPPAFDLTFHEDDWLTLARAHTDLDKADFRADFRDIKI